MSVLLALSALVAMRPAAVAPEFVGSRLAQRRGREADPRLPAREAHPRRVLDLRLLQLPGQPAVLRPARREVPPPRGSSSSRSTPPSWRSSATRRRSPSTSAATGSTIPSLSTARARTGTAGASATGPPCSSWTARGGSRASGRASSSTAARTARRRSRRRSTACSRRGRPYVRERLGTGPEDRPGRYTPARCSSRSFPLAPSAGSSVPARAVGRLVRAPRPGGGHDPSRGTAPDPGGNGGSRRPEPVRTGPEPGRRRGLRRERGQGPMDRFVAERRRRRSPGGAGRRYGRPRLRPPTASASSGEAGSGAGSGSSTSRPTPPSARSP